MCFISCSALLRIIPVGIPFSSVVSGSSEGLLL